MSVERGSRPRSTRTQAASITPRRPASSIEPHDLGDLRDVGHRLEAPERSKSRTGALRTQPAFGQRAKFLFDLPVALGLRQVALLAAGVTRPALAAFQAH